MLSNTLTMWQVPCTGERGQVRGDGGARSPRGGSHGQGESEAADPKGSHARARPGSKAECQAGTTAQSPSQPTLSSVPRQGRLEREAPGDRALRPSARSA